jgi:general secretion pathway protein G
MVDYNSLKKKFPNKNPDKNIRKKKIKAISLEFKAKKAELEKSSPPLLKKGMLFYVIIIAGLAILGSMVLSMSGKGGKKFISKAKINSEKSINVLAIALGRYRYHTGVYPTTEEGLQQLAAILPNIKGWNGPYIRRVVKDPWGNDYVYICKGQTEDPSLFSKGPDGLEGTADDVLPEKGAFDKPFRDLSWLKGWMPHNLRGYVLVKDEAEKKSVSNTVQSHLQDYSEKLKSRKIDFGLEEIIKMTSFNDELFKDYFSAWPMEMDDIRFLMPWTAAKEGDFVAVRCTSKSEDAAELFVGKKSFGRAKKVNGILEWKVPFQFDKLNVIAFRGASPASSAELYPNSTPEAMKLSSNVLTVSETGFALVAVEVVDKRGNIVDAKNLPIEVSLEGPARIAAKSVGKNLALSDKAEMNNFKLDGLRTFFVVQRLPGSGKSIVFTVKSKTLQPAKITFGRSL